MTEVWKNMYTRIAPPRTGLSRYNLWHSTALSDARWDAFLRSVPSGQFQQSSMWAEYKAGEGWRHHREILTDDKGIAGGFQILTKKTRWARIGYVSKGPVLRDETVGNRCLLDTLLLNAARTLGLIAMIVQRPDESSCEADPDGGRVLIPSNPLGVIEATYVVDVRPDLEILRRSMSASLRRNIRKARKMPSVVREGTEADLPLFFDLMAETCRRQNTRPNPGSVTALKQLWRAFAPTKSIRLTFADCDGVSPAAKLSLVFGDRMTVWKKGWDSSHDEWHTNELLEDDALAWAHEHGYRLCDFCSFDRAAARRLSNGQPVVGKSLSTRDEYHLRFGGYPLLLPVATVLIPNPILRWSYRNSVARLEAYRKKEE